jgi:Flp pilus assembly protein TadG
VAPFRSTAGFRPAQRRGASAVEFALILPLLITIVLGCVDFGRFAYYYIAVTNGARVGAGFASVNPVTSVTMPWWVAKIKDAVVEEMGAAFVPEQITVVSPPPIPEPQGQGQKRVSVTVSYPFQTLVPWPWLPNSMTLTRTVVMRLIR